MLIGSGLALVAAAVAAGVAFTGVAKGIVGIAKAVFFGLLALAGVLAALGMFASKKIHS